MPKIPIVSAIEVIKALSKVGYDVDHQTGSHIILRQREPPYRRITVPNHKEIAKGTLKAIMEETGMRPDEFFALL